MSMILDLINFSRHRNVLVSGRLIGAVSVIIWHRAWHIQAWYIQGKAFTARRCHSFISLFFLCLEPLKSGYPRGANKWKKSWSPRQKKVSKISKKSQKSQKKIQKSQKSKKRISKISKKISKISKTSKKISKISKKSHLSFFST